MNTEDGAESTVEDPRSQTEKVRDRNRQLMYYFERNCPMFIKWLGELSRFGGNMIDAMELSVDEIAPAEGCNEWPPAPPTWFRARLFTSRYMYAITNSVKPDFNYLGCTVSVRKPRAGEDWHRGTDLADGDYCEETWHKILANIVAYEMVRLGN